MLAVVRRAVLRVVVMVEGDITIDPSLIHLCIHGVSHDSMGLAHSKPG